MFDKAALMHKAWEVHRSIRTRYADWQIAHGIVDASFSSALKTAWRIAKAEAAKLAEQARLAAALAGPKGSTVAAIRSEIENLTFLPFRYDIGQRRQSLEAQLRYLLAA